ncbi:MAG: hypothetical protein Q9187_000301 [Circinaria calcarea]
MSLLLDVNSASTVSLAYPRLCLPRKNNSALAKLCHAALDSRLDFSGGNSGRRQEGPLNPSISSDDVIGVLPFHLPQLMKADKDQLRIRASCALGVTTPAANEPPGENRQTVSVDCLGHRQSSRGIVIATYG